jgi:hypothetical protein
MNNTTIVPTPTPTLRPYSEGLNGNDDSLNVILPITFLFGSVLLVSAAVYCCSCFKNNDPPLTGETYYYLDD